MLLKNWVPYKSATSWNHPETRFRSFLTSALITPNCEAATPVWKPLHSNQKTRGHHQLIWNPLLLTSNFKASTTWRGKSVPCRFSDPGTHSWSARPSSLVTGPLFHGPGSTGGVDKARSAQTDISLDNKEPLINTVDKTKALIIPELFCGHCYGDYEWSKVIFTSEAAEPLCGKGCSTLLLLAFLCERLTGKNQTKRFQLSTCMYTRLLLKKKNCCVFALLCRFRTFWAWERCLGTDVNMPHYFQSWWIIYSVIILLLCFSRVIFPAA